MTLRAGEQIGGKYTLKQLLGAGGFGEVWLASNARGENVALKVLQAEHAQDPEAMKRFAREAKVLERLDHPRIARALGSWSEGGPHPYIAMEYVEGRTLDAVIAARAKDAHPFADAEVLAVLRELVAAVSFAHERGVAHRDLKPKNVMLGDGGPSTIKVLDFGLAKLTAEPSAETTAGRVYGSLLYLSPEQANGQPAGPRADIFALGTIAFEILTLRRTWARDAQDRPLDAATPFSPHDPLNNALTVGLRIMGGARPSVAEFRGGASTEVDRVLGRALDRDPEARFESCDAFLRALEAAFGEAPHATKHRSILKPALTLAALAGAAIAGVMMLPREREAPIAPPPPQIEARVREEVVPEKIVEPPPPEEIKEESKRPATKRAAKAIPVIAAPAVVHTATPAVERVERVERMRTETARANAEIAALIEQLQKSPNDVQLRVRTSSAILHAAELLPEEQRWRVKNEVMRASFGGGVSALSSAFRALTREQVTP